MLPTDTNEEWLQKQKEKLWEGEKAPTEMGMVAIRICQIKKLLQYFWNKRHNEVIWYWLPLLDVNVLP